MICFSLANGSFAKKSPIKHKQKSFDCPNASWSEAVVFHASHLAIQKAECSLSLE